MASRDVIENKNPIIDAAIFLSDRVLIMSAGPGLIITDFAIDLPRPRLPEMAAEPAFIELKW